MKTFKRWEHTGWGDQILVLDKDRVTGHLQQRPAVGDHLHTEMASGKIGVFVFKEVDLMRDPPDQFFAKVKFIGYQSDIVTKEQ